MADAAGGDGGETGDRALMNPSCRARFACASWSMFQSCGYRVELPCSTLRAGVGFGGRCVACTRLSDLALALFARLASADSSAALVNAVVDRNAD